MLVYGKVKNLKRTAILEIKMALLKKKYEGLMVQFIQFEVSLWVLVANMLTKLYGQSGNKWSSILLPGN